MGVLTVTEEERQMLLLSLALLQLDRPGWAFAIGELVKKVPGGQQMFDEFLRIHREGEHP